MLLTLSTLEAAPSWGLTLSCAQGVSQIQQDVRVPSALSGARSRGDLLLPNLPLGQLTFCVNFCHFPEMSNTSQFFLFTHLITARGGASVSKQLSVTSSLIL